MYCSRCDFMSQRLGECTCPSFHLQREWVILFRVFLTKSWASSPQWLAFSEKPVRIGSVSLHSTWRWREIQSLKNCGINKRKAKNNPRYKSKINLHKFACLIHKCLTRDSDLMWSQNSSRRFQRRICLLFWFCRTVQRECTRTWAPLGYQVQWLPANLQQWIPHRLDDDTGRPVYLRSKNKIIKETFDHLNHVRGRAVSGL